MQNPSSLLNTTTGRQFSQSVKHFFNIPAEHPRLLKRQPLSQRRLFLDKAIQNHYIIFAQFRPRLQSSDPMNVRGEVHQLDDRRYLITRGHVNYLFTMDELQYLARI